MIKKLISGHYSKMLLICIVTVCTVTVTLFLLSSALIQEQEKNEYLKNYDIEINNLSSILSAKQNSLSNTLAPVFSSAARYQKLCRFYQDESSLSSADKLSLVEMLGEICKYDQYCRGILLQTSDGRLYQYSITYNTLMPLLRNPAEIPMTPYQIQVLSDAKIDALGSGYEKPADHVFGLTGTIFDYSEDDLISFGQIIILYSTAEFTNSIMDASLDEDALFLVMDEDKNIIYSSDGNYDSAESRLLSGFSMIGADTGQINMQPVKSTKNGTDYYYASVYNSRYAFYTGYQIPASRIDKSYVQAALGVLALFICLSSILLYVITLRISDRKIKTIQSGMSLVGQNNLDYRLPVPKSKDEFTQIIKSFNRMCDDLELNVKKAYLYEISQKKAELYAMQTSINPHFLYNTLEQIRVQIMQNRANDASQMLLLLSRMYRNQTRRNLYVSVGEELDLCENLINLYMYRYGNFEYEFIIGNSLKIYGIPKNTLQPLVENYFAHGLVGNREDNYLTIKVTNEQDDKGGYLQFIVADNGSSITPFELSSLKEKLEQPVLSRQEDNGFALSNVNTRLKLVFGESSGLIPSTCPDGSGFQVTFRIPLILPQELM